MEHSRILSSIGARNVVPQFIWYKFNKKATVKHNSKLIGNFLFII